MGSSAARRFLHFICTTHADPLHSSWFTNIYWFDDLGTWWLYWQRAMYLQEVPVVVLLLKRSFWPDTHLKIIVFHFWRWALEGWQLLVRTKWAIRASGRRTAPRACSSWRGQRTTPSFRRQMCRTSSTGHSCWSLGIWVCKKPILLHCTVLYYCIPLLYYTMLCYTVYAILCYSVLCNANPCFTILYYTAILYYTVLCYYT